MATATFETYDPANTTSTVFVPTEAEPSLSPVPLAADLVYVQGGWLPRDQEYYWTEAWQADEQATLAQIAAGEGVEFDNASDLARWLFGSS